MIRAGDERELFWVGGRSDDLFEFGLWSEPVVVSTEEELGQSAGGQKGICELVSETLRGNAESGESVEICAGRWSVAAAGDEGHGGSEAEAHNDDGEIELGVEPVEGSGDVGGFGEAFVVAFAQAGAAEVEAEYRKAEAPVRSIEDLHGVVDDLVVKCAAA